MSTLLYPKIAEPAATAPVHEAHVLMMLTDFALSDAELAILPEQCGGKVIIYSEASFANRSIGDVLGLNTDCRAIVVNIGDVLGRRWVSKNIRALKSMPSLLAVTSRSARQPWIRAIQPAQVMKRGDLPVAERLIDTLGELLPFLHLTAPPSLIVRIFRALWGFVCKSDQARL